MVDTRVVELKEKNKPVHCYLFNDLLILVVVSRLEQLGSVMKGYVPRRPSCYETLGRLTPGSVARHLSSLGSSFHPIEWTELGDIRVTRVEKTESILALTSRKNKWHLQFTSLESLQEWRHLLSECQAKLEEATPN